MITLICTLCTTFASAQSLDFREDINLSGFSYKIYTKTLKTAASEKTVYVIPSKTDTIFHDALVKDLKANKELSRGIYKNNADELHYLQFDLTTNKIDHTVYVPNRDGRLVMVKEKKNLDAYPKDFPPKFKDNKPIHPIFPDGQNALYKWVENNLYPILAQKHKINNKGNAIIILDIASDGSVALSELKNLSASAETFNKLSEKLTQMPKWETKIQGYNVAGLVFVPINF